MWNFLGGLFWEQGPSFSWLSLSVHHSPMLSGRMRRLYWVDSQLDLVGHIDFQGNDRQTFTSLGEITQPFSLTVYKGGICSFLVACLNGL